MRVLAAWRIGLIHANQGVHTMALHKQDAQRKFQHASNHNAQRSSADQCQRQMPPACRPWCISRVVQSPHTKRQHCKCGKDAREQNQDHSQRRISYVLSLRMQPEGDTQNNQVQDHEYPEAGQRKFPRGLPEKYLANTMIETGTASNYTCDGKGDKQNNARKKAARARVLARSDTEKRQQPQAAKARQKYKDGTYQGRNPNAQKIGIAFGLRRLPHIRSIRIVASRWIRCIAIVARRRWSVRRWKGAIALIRRVLRVHRIRRRI